MKTAALSLPAVPVPRPSRASLARKLTSDLIWSAGGVESTTGDERKPVWQPAESRTAAPSTAPRERKSARIAVMGVEDGGDPRMLGGSRIESQITRTPRPEMDRHVEFTTQLAHLVALYARDKVDNAAEKAALRSARDAAKHGAL